jgi:hypothetical protein
VISEFWVVKNMIGCSRATTILEFWKDKVFLGY